MIKKIKNEYRRFIKKNFDKIFGKVNFNLGSNVWADIWKDYYINNLAAINEKRANLKTGLDEESIKTIKLIEERYIKIIPPQKYKDCFFYKPDKLFTNQEIKGQKENFYADRSLYKLPHGLYYEESIFKYAHGLTLLSNDILESIKDKDFIDGGAFAGDSAIVFKTYTNCRVHSFEPDVNNFKLLKETIKLNNYINQIIPVNKGLGAISEEITLYPTEFCNSAIVKQSNINGFQINVVDIDSYADKNNLQIGLIKLDVEGYELEVIQGAIKTIQKDKPVLLISIYHHPKDFFEIKPLIQNLIPGYKFLVRKLNDNSLTYETMLIGWFEN